MPNAFNFSASPFDCLSSLEQKLVRDNVDIAYFREHDSILDAQAPATHLFVIIKGHVNQLEGNEVIATFGPDDSFDGRGLMAGKASSRFIAAEEVVAYQLTKAAIAELISSNATFGALLFSDLSKKLSALTDRQSQQELQSLGMARVDQAYVRPAHHVTGDTDVMSVVKILHAQRTTNVLVHDPHGAAPRLGIFTSTALQRAILSGTPLDQLQVKDWANYTLVKVKPSEHLYDALAVMIRHKVHRVVVASEDKILGFLEQVDLLSFISNHSYLISLQIIQAQDLGSLKQAAIQITQLISLLHRGGTKVSLIAKLVQELNAKLFERTWQLVARADLVQNSCLFVMGSEGRGEQLLKTDQDNGLILRDGFDFSGDLSQTCQLFSDALKDFGYPECPGGIMINNPQWRYPAHAFGQMVRKWLLLPTAEDLMALAIFIDAHPVCGDADLLDQVRGEIFKLVINDDAMLARFASAINAFDQSSGWWNRLISLGDHDQNHLNLKKAAIFPLVHGIRSMALQARLTQTNTAERIEALVQMGKLPASLGTDLIDSLHFFMSLKLKAGLNEMDMNRQISGAVALNKLSSLDRDLLKDTLSVVKRFKVLLRHHFHLELM
jgi:CBS domain-containing protein